MMILPIHPQPQPDELLSSWILRLAHENLIKVHSLHVHFLHQTQQIWNRDIDVLASKQLVSNLHKLSGISERKLRDTTLRSYESIIFREITEKTSNSWLLSQGIYHRTRKNYGLQYCPLCLKSDAKPYFRKVWRLAFYTVCEKHNMFLYDSCYICDAPIIFFRNDIGHKNKVFNHQTIQCHICLADISQAPVKECYIQNMALSKAFTQLLKTPSLGYTSHPLPLSSYSCFFFETLRRICVLSINCNKKYRFYLNEIEKEIGISCLESTSDKTGGGLIESHRIDERHNLILKALWLMIDWPYRFNYYIKKWKYPPSILYKDMREIPYLLYSATKL